MQELKKKDFKDPPAGVDMKKIKKVIIASLLFIAFFSCFAVSSLAAATHYNLSSGCFVGAWHGYDGQTWSPTTRGKGPYQDAALTDLELNATNASDYNRVHLYRPEGEVLVNALLVQVRINETEALVNNITVVVEGYPNDEDNNYNRTELWIWNTTGWEQFNQSNVSLRADYETIQEFTGRFDEFIESDEIWVLYTAQTGNETSNDRDLYVDFIDIYVSEGTERAAKYQALNDTYPNIGESVVLTVNLTDCFGNWSWLQTNESGRWVTHDDVYDSPRYMPNATANNQTNFTWANSSLCNRVVGFRVKYNRSDGTVLYTALNVSYVIPFINGTAANVYNVSNSYCQNSTHINFSFTDAATDSLEIWLGWVQVDSNKTCPYNSSAYSQYNISNTTNYCYLSGELTGIAAGGWYYITRIAAYEFEVPPNIPAAIAVTTILTIIVVVITTKVRRKAGG